MTEIEHGTYAGYQQHRRRDDTACLDCRRAAAKYSREYRTRRQPEKRAKELATERARRQALAELVRLHADEFRALVAKHRETT